jgi:hypothetical protein
MKNHWIKLDKIISKHLSEFFLAISLLILLTGCESISGYFWYISLKPDKSFDESGHSNSPSYSDINNWAAHPDIKDNSDLSLHESNITSQTQKEVDVFFVHPTTYYSSESWNQPLSDTQANDLTNNWVLLNQASVFSDCCSVYVPRYRQATLYAVLSDDPEGDKALELAYQDVKESFKYFLKNFNQVRPFIIASHSQGSWHALRLIEELVIASKLKDKLVAAYLVGMPLPTDKTTRSLVDLPVCTNETQNRCFVTWNAVTNNADTGFYHEYARVWYEDSYEANQGKALVCVNPLTWLMDGKFANSSLNKGGVDFKRNESIKPSPDVGVVGAQCINGMLNITNPKSRNYDWFLFGDGNYHMHDYDLFYVNIRDNVQSRIQAYFEQDTISN